MCALSLRRIRDWVLCLSLYPVVCVKLGITGRLVVVILLGSGGG